MSRAKPKGRDSYRWFTTITTRWMDNDVYHHVNNVQYYSFFDTAVNLHLVQSGVLDITGSDAVGVVAETQCAYFASVAFPDLVHAGIAVERLGDASVVYDVGLFRNDAGRAAAQGRFVHVYVRRGSSETMRIPDPVRSALEPLLRAASSG